MANGDAAAAAGYPTVPATADKRLGYDEINLTRDLVAAVKAAAATAQTTANSKQANLGYTPVRQGGGTDMANNVVRIGWNTAGTALIAQVDGVPLGSFVFHGAPGVSFGNVYLTAASPAVSGYTAAYINSDGRISRGASSRRYKQDIQEWTPEQQAVLAMQLYQFRYIQAVEEQGDDAAVEVGVMAEDLHELGLSWLVYYDEEGRPDGVHYERITLALIPIVQSMDARLAALEAKLGGDS